MKQIVFATENPGKLHEVRGFASQYGYEVLSPSEAGFERVEVEETGTTYEENARLKVKAYMHQPAAKKFVICGDDTGIEIHALNNEPGIHSRRWLGYRMSDEEIIGYTLGRMHGVRDRSAVFKATVAYSINGEEIQIVSGELSGTITEMPTQVSPLQAGIPFRQIFIIDGDPPIPAWKFGDMSLEERDGILGHREAAFKQIFEDLEEKYDRY